MEGKKQKNTKRNYTFAVGRRKESVARVRLYEGKEQVTWADAEVKKGELYVNGMLAEKYFGTNVAKAVYEEPFKITGSVDRFIVTAKVDGGGKSGQLIAVVHGIARALSGYDREKYRKVLQKRGMLTRDARARQRRNVGMGGKSRRKKQSPKR